MGKLFQDKLGNVIYFGGYIVQENPPRVMKVLRKGRIFRLLDMVNPYADEIMIPSDEIVNTDWIVIGEQPSIRMIKKLLLAEYNFCIWCGATLTEETATLEHLIPKSKGGRTEAFNIELSCHNCNKRKSNMDIDVFLNTHYAKEILIHHGNCVAEGDKVRIVDGRFKGLDGVVVRQRRAKSTNQWCVVRLNPKETIANVKVKDVRIMSLQKDVVAV
jgi:hypothetical protein